MAQQGKEFIEVVDDQVGSPTYTIDISKALVRLVDFDTPSILHICNDGYCSWYQFARKILDLTGFSHVKTIPVTTKKFGRPAARPGYSVLNCEKFAQLTGAKFRHWESALIDFLEELT
ncbi:MAG: hypothetical protein A2161_00085 [Candidatus Schekmanbacteria bacterium RBG_13_48_7]|uniref:dTDP-4-dehydrorhamnose reductase n=1 Tax=Candidatus Schekmanbacteria bacterium RBG_13_48_7 TaxID=1817878 RepID=A0A1F7S2H2_9BACT|nr:MAG: hypothetical protein A2161_00085 [Candidatus Schekmanbacteria bacterium RBG_13_48_7]